MPTLKYEMVGKNILVCKLSTNPTNVDIEHFARAYILKLIGGYLMPDKSSKEVYLMYLPLLGRLDSRNKAVAVMKAGQTFLMQAILMRKILTPRVKDDIA
ncbi:serine/threonine-protein phosphatase 7 long form-like protein [Senna tora]|uniref:Serine/threonine-protein phosphatase 7 long form-like protein n=1 Tax=Senna tora TaxID=362788 RepID=A0A834SG45_9FABA|nr:serine/threonine-protein phosphatase 7 long form-like protein [Senna tora]